MQRLESKSKGLLKHEKMGKGVTLSNDELKILKELLNSIDI